MIEKKIVKCPRCKVNTLDACGNALFFCSNCRDIYRRSKSSRLNKLTVDPVADLSTYPTVIIDPAPPYCSSRIEEYCETFTYQIGPHYCPKHNVIVVEGIFEPEDKEIIYEISIRIVTHETVHWVLCKTLGEQVSAKFDSDAVWCFTET